jgi:hypothetical protein
MTALVRGNRGVFGDTVDNAISEVTVTKNAGDKVPLLLPLKEALGSVIAMLQSVKASIYRIALIL